MGDVLTGVDSICEYLTGVAADGNSQTHVDSSIGGYRARQMVKSIDYEIGPTNFAFLQGLTIKDIPGTNPLGKGYLAVDSGTLTWKPPLKDFGDPVPISSGQEVFVSSFTNPAEFIRVALSGAMDNGTNEIDLREAVHNVFAMSIVTDMVAASGTSQYRATIIRNESSHVVFGLGRFIEELASPITGNTTRLGASGSGTIVISGSFADWPASGWCRIQKVDLSLREIVYYGSRTSTTLAVGSSGRARLGTSASAGASTDILHAVPGVAIAKAAEGVQDLGSAIQLIASEVTAPTGVTWNTAIDPTNGLTVASLGVGKQIGIWIWREIPVGASFYPQHSVRFSTVFDSYVTNQRGGFRIQNNSARGYVVHVGVNAMPNLDGPYTAFSAVLPISSPLALPGSPTAYYVVVRKRNAFGMISKNQQPTIIYLDSSGIIAPPVNPPTKLILQQQTDFHVMVVSIYNGYSVDPNKPNKLRVWIGTSPPNILVDVPSGEFNIKGDTVKCLLDAGAPGLYYVVTAHYRSFDDTQSVGLSNQIIVVPAPSAPVTI